MLLDAWRIEAELVSVHRHNERSRLDSVLERLSTGQRVALVSDAGAPGVSDPGGHLIQAVRAAGFPVVALPGASAVITTLMSFGTTTDDHPGFAFLGFLPSKPGQRQRLLQRWLDYDGTLVCFEAPHRLQACLQDMLAVFGGQREVGLARELTKRFEETVRLPLSQVQQWLESDNHRLQGEYVLLVSPLQGVMAGFDDESDMAGDASIVQWADALLAHISTRDAARIMAKALAKPRDACYAWLLARSAQRDAGHDPD